MLPLLPLAVPGAIHPWVFSIGKQREDVGQIRPSAANMSLTLASGRAP